jgi:hypothetical protein
MARKYYSVLEKLPNSTWAPQFGDYDREVAEQEMRDMKDSGSFVKGTKLKVVSSSGTHDAIMIECDKLNAKEKA